MGGVGQNMKVRSQILMAWRQVVAQEPLLEGHRARGCRPLSPRKLGAAGQAAVWREWEQPEEGCVHVCGGGETFKHCRNKG